MESYLNNAFARRYKTILNDEMEIAEDFFWPVQRDAVAVDLEGQMGLISYRSETRWKLEKTNVWAKAYVRFVFGIAGLFHGRSRLGAELHKGLRQWASTLKILAIKCRLV